MARKVARSQEAGHPDVSQEEAFLEHIFFASDMHPYDGLLFFAGTVWAACRMNSWCFNYKTGKVIAAFSPHEKELAKFFVIGKCLDYVVANREHRFPFILSDSLGLMWIAEYSPIEEEETPVLFVFGPVFTSATSPLVLTDNLNQMNFSISLRKQIEKVLDDVPILMNSAIEQYARMLHFVLTGEPCDTKRFKLQKATVEADLYSGREESGFEDISGRHMSLEQVLVQESQLLAMIREGRLDETLLASLRRSVDCADYTGGNPLRNAKDELVILCTKYMLAAEEAKLPNSVSRVLHLRYVRAIEKCRTLTELTNVAYSMTEEFVQRIHEVAKHPEWSQEILIAEDYIRSNLTSKLSIEKVASHVGYSDYYLSKKFAAETGMLFADYVNQERIHYAQTLLRTGNLSVQTISEMLQYSSTSYFGRVFKKTTGMTPTEYRDGRKG